MDKRVAPTFWALIIVVVVAAYAGIFMMIDLWPVRIVAGIIAAALIGAMLYVLGERYREIKKGETDDLSQY